jgi:hypothetical protein
MRLNILVEGQTEESFVWNLLQPHLSHLQLYPFVVTTNNKPGGRGGNTNRTFVYADRDLRRLLGQCRQGKILLTTMLDLYALAPDAPGVATAPSNDPYRRVAHIENEFIQHYGSPHLLIPYLSLHEFEALVLADINSFGEILPGEDAATGIANLKNDIGSTPPEEVNENPETAPSKRIERLVPGYRKRTSGVLIAQQIGLAKIRSKCPHFDEWLTRLESL